MTVASRAVSTLARVAPLAADADSELDRALAVVDADVDAATLVEAAYGAAIVGAFVGLLAAAGVGLAAGAAVVAVGAAAGYALVAAPRWFASAHEARALGGGPTLVALAALRVRLGASPEAAAKFAATHATGPLATSLAAHRRRVRGTDAWDAFAATWRDRDPAFARAASLLGTATEVPDDERPAVLDRAEERALEGVRDRLAAYAAALHAPTTALYAFGVVLPLSLVAALPAVRGAGLALPMAAVAVAYDLLLPAGLLLAAGRLLAGRPAAFPATPVPAGHERITAYRWGAPVAGVAAGGAALLAAGPLVPRWTGPPAAAGLACGVTAVLWYEPVRRVRAAVVELEREFPDALALVGGHVDDGTSVEAAVRTAADELDGPAGAALSAAARRRRALGVPVSTALVGEHGPLAALPSRRLRATAELLDVAARAGRPAGDLLVDLADHLDRLQSVETETRRELASVVGTLRATACCFAPLVGGVTVSLAGRVGSETASGRLPPLDVGTLGVVVGVYVVLLAAILGALSTALAVGTDRARLLHAAGGATAAASVCYALAATVAGVVA